MDMMVADAARSEPVRSSAMVAKLQPVDTGRRTSSTRRTGLSQVAKAMTELSHSVMVVQKECNFFSSRILGVEADRQRTLIGLGERNPWI